MISTLYYYSDIFEYLNYYRDIYYICISLYKQLLGEEIKKYT